MNIQNIVKVGTSRQVVIPMKLWKELKIHPGDYMEVKRQQQDILLKPKILVDKDLDADLAQSFKDFEEGRSYGPFNTVDEMFKSLDANVKRIRIERRKQKRVLR